MSRWGLSWGGRLFRVGQSPNGRWWAYFNLFGFRFFRYLDDHGQRRWVSARNVTPMVAPAESQERPVVTGRVPDSNKWNPQDFAPDFDAVPRPSRRGRLAEAGTDSTVAKRNEAIKKAIRGGGGSD
jgi:hypothetical protein